MRALPLFLLLSASPALADVVADSGDTAEEDDSDKDGGCASAPMSSEALGSVALGALLLVGLRRSR
ncbi:MAG: hypothetical protein H6741_06360 [Alphaproteobacteria bacterium]|nr:hypothetical protein [Alphaproteobacteria bacterium]MCB9792333.1 hypothetical protein [Alphaproteobacteria bacterium]